MPSRTSQIARVGKRQIELSNLTKVLYPDDGIVKAQLIEYYLRIAPTLLAHVKGRPLSLVRFPDGIKGESFFSKKPTGLGAVLDRTCDARRREKGLRYRDRRSITCLVGKPGVH